MTNSFKNHYAIVCTLLIGIALFTSCSKDRDDDLIAPTEKQADVYVAGEVLINGQYVATLWKNGMASTLTDNTVLASSANDVFVSGNDVYVAGAERRLSSATFSTAQLWKNNIPIDLALAGAKGSSAQAVVVAGDDVYVGGYEVISGVRRAKIWKNGKLRYTFPQNTIEMVYEIAVQGTDIYVVGYPTASPVYWKISATNETSIDVPLLDWAHGITVKGNDVYVSGNKGDKARYVKNGSAVDLTDGTNYAYCNSIFLSGNDVYAVGAEEKSDGTEAPKYWNNSTAIGLASGNSNTHGNSIFVWNSKVYVAGADEDAPYLWEDGKQTKLANEGVASAVFVVDRS